MAIGLVVLLYATWSSVFSLAKVALQDSPPVFLTGFRMLLGSAIILGFLAIARRSSLKLTRKQIFSLGLLGFFSVYLSNVLEFSGLSGPNGLTAAKACFIYGLSPFFAPLFSYLHFKEKMNGRKWIGMMIALFGTVPVLLLQNGSEGFDFNFFSGPTLMPTLALIGATLSSVYGWVLLRVAVKDSSISPITANGVSMLFGGLMALVHSTFIDSWQPLPVAADKWGHFLPITIAITCISSVLCYNLYGMLLKRFTATFLSFMGLLSPFFASMHGWLFLDEPVSWVIFASTAILSLGLWIVYSAELKQGYIVKAASKSENQPATDS